MHGRRVRRERPNNQSVRGRRGRIRNRNISNNFYSAEDNILESLLLSLIPENKAKKMKTKINYHYMILKRTILLN
jgi:hypothetical protein